MKRIEINELHNIYYKRFKMFHSFLVENNISYYAIGGTLLGAIRNNGIIPWDNDMDICMTRDEYNKFLTILDKMDTRYLKPINYHINNYVEHPITKIILVGVIKTKSRLTKKYDNHYHIDVFPIDHVFSDLKKQQKTIKKVAKYKKILLIKSRALNFKNPFKRLLVALLKIIIFPISSKSVCKKYDCLVCLPETLREENKDIYWTSGGVYSFEKESHKTCHFGKPVLHTFGTCEIYIPEKSHEFLIETYGKDYMIPYNRYPNAVFDCALDDEYIDAH